MMGTTHAPIGALCGIATLRTLELAGVHLPASYPAADLIAAGVGLITALLPDIDQPSSIIANPGRQAKNVAQGLGVKRDSLGGLAIALPFMLVNLPVHALAVLLRATLGHRGVMHSLGAAVACAVLVGLATWGIAGVAWCGLTASLALVGYLSHLLSDDLTHSTMPLLWPLYRQKLHLLPLPVRVSASGIVNSVLGVLATVATLAIAVSPQGWAQLGSMIRRVIGG